MPVTRRELLISSVLTAGTFLPDAISGAELPKKPGNADHALPFRFCLNTGTISGYKLSMEEEIDIAAQAGYRHIEPWMRRITAYLEKGGKPAELRKRFDGAGLTIENVMTFSPWVVDDAAKRSAGIEQMKREMETIRELGGKRLAATAAGVGDVRMTDFRTMGDRYRTVLEIGETMDVVPQLEIWGGVKTLNCLADALAVAAEAGHPKAALLLDAFHLYRGGSSFEGLRMLNGRTMSVFHLNDYPAEPPREKAADKDRLFPGDGICPLNHVLRILRDTGFRGVLSLEVFNPLYWKKYDPVTLCKKGLEKMRAVAAGTTI